jgi:RHS repeat-associated protein
VTIVPDSLDRIKTIRHDFRRADDSVGAKTFTYDYDAVSRIEGIDVTDTTNYNTLDFAGVSNSVDYAYDTNDQLVRRTNGSDVEHYVIEGGQVLMVYDETGERTNRYLFGPGVDMVVADERWTDSNSDTFGDVYWPLLDQQRTVRDVLTEEGKLYQHLSYDAFGDITGVEDISGNTAAIDTLFAYTGRQWDDDAQLYSYRARWYDPDSGRFLSEDPIGFDGGDANLYRYVGNGVTFRVDPSGLSSQEMKPGSGVMSFQNIKQTPHPSPGVGASGPFIVPEVNVSDIRMDAFQYRAPIPVDPERDRLVFAESLRREEVRQLVAEQHASYGSIGARDPYDVARDEMWAAIQQRYSPQEIRFAQWKIQMQDLGYSSFEIGLGAFLLPTEVTNAPLSGNDILMVLAGFAGANPIAPRTTSARGTIYSWGSPTVQLPLREPLSPPTPRATIAPSRVAGVADDAHNAARFAAYKEELARLEFSQQARWKPASGGHGDELVHHAYNRHPSLATNDRGLIDPALYDARARANIVNAGSEIHSLGNGRYAAFDPNSGGFTVFSWQGQGGLPAGTPTIHSYYIPLRNQLKSGVPFNSQGVVNLNDVRPR